MESIQRKLTRKGGNLENECGPGLRGVQQCEMRHLEDRMHRIPLPERLFWKGEPCQVIMME